MRVLISGGGIAGLTLVYWLHQYHIPTVVIEQAESGRHNGYGLDFYGMGYDVAEQMGLLDALGQQQILFEDVSYVNARGKTIAHIPHALMLKVMYNRYMALMHGTLEDVLYKAVADDVEVRPGSTLASVRPGPDEVAVTFHDGTTDTFDVVIGADGVHSHVRHMVFGPETLFQRYLGSYFASYPLPDRYGVGHAWKNYVEPGRLAGAYCSNNEGEIITFLMYKAADEGHVPRELRLPKLRQVFAGMGWITQHLLEDIPDPDSIFIDTMTQIQMPSWHLGRVALVGDACGCPTSLSGQGASLAMGGAYLLAQALHEAPDYETAFLRYEQRLRPYVERRQKNARNIAGTFLPENTFMLVLQQIMLKLLLREAFSGLLRRQFGVESFLPTKK